MASEVPSPTDCGTRSQRPPDVDLQQLIAQACDFSDVLDLAQNPKHPFKLASNDPKRNIKMYTMHVSSSPIQLMKASVTMPCSPVEFLRYLDMDVRSLWDDHFLEGVVVKELIRPLTMAQQKEQPSSTSIPSPSANSGSEIKVQVKHIAFQSPIPLLLHRDFELIIAEHITAQGTAILKAISPPSVGVIVPRRGEFVRGIVSISGFVCEPCEYDLHVGPEKSTKGCKVTYIALVHPMGMVPPFLVNVVVGKQTSAMAHLQEFIAAYPLKKLMEAGLITREKGSVCGQVMKRRRLHSKL